MLRNKSRPNIRSLVEWVGFIEAFKLLICNFIGLKYWVNNFRCYHLSTLYSFCDSKRKLYLRLKDSFEDM